jgi:hypothetical protein
MTLDLLRAAEREAHVVYLRAHRQWVKAKAALIAAGG